MRLTNVFALIEQFAYCHSSSKLESPNPPPSLLREIQYWAGVIMRNACRKDDSRGRIWQCANSEFLVVLPLSCGPLTSGYSPLGSGSSSRAARKAK